MSACYFDTSVFLAIFNGESTGPSIRGLLRELKGQKVRIYTSILTIQEASVLALRRGARPDDLHGQVNKLARIQSITREIAIGAALLEAQVIARMDKASLSAEERIGINRRRKWDCFHIATALNLGCRTLYALDDKMINKRLQLDIRGIDFLEPVPSAQELFPEQSAPPPFIQ